jgi:hypothetical protein
LRSRTYCIAFSNLYGITAALVGKQMPHLTNASAGEKPKSLVIKYPTSGSGPDAVFSGYIVTAQQV